MMKKKFLVLILVILMSALIFPQGADDITVPLDYKVEKIAETNKVGDPWGLTQDSEGNIIVASQAYAIFKVNQNGDVEQLGFSRRFGFGFEDVKISPLEEYILIGTYGISGVSKIVTRFTPPDNFQTLISPGHINSITYDNLGNFYVGYWDYDTSQNKITRYNDQFQEVDTIILGYSATGIEFNSDNDMFICNRIGGKIYKILAGPNGIPGPEDPIQVVATGLNRLLSMTIDESDILYITEFTHEEIDGFSLFDKYRLLKLDSTNGSILGVLATDLHEPWGLLIKDGYIYVSDYVRAIILKVNLSTLEVSNHTEDYGIPGAGPIAFDQNDRLYTTSFRMQRLFKLNEAGAFDQVGAGIGVTQSVAQNLASDGTYFYMGSYDLATSNGFQVIKIDPMAETVDVIGTHYDGWRSVAFDSYGRLVLNTVIDYPNNLYGADIIDLNTGTATPYVTGLHNKGRCIQFDNRQHLYFVEGIGDGIKKVQLEENYDPPRDLGNEPLFYDFRTEPDPPTIYFFHVNLLEEVTIPLMDTGTILLGDKEGNVETFTEDFLSPVHVTFDRYGSMYVTDMNNGVFKISYAEWTLPYIIKIKDNLIEEIQNSDIHHGIKNSLVKKLENADKSLEKGNIKPAINQIKAFRNEVLAQKGKKVPEELADIWIEIASKIITALEAIL
jgi:hypothetical protein